MLTVKYFMWGYQPHFRFQVQHEARKLLQKFDPRFNPKVFLVGFRSRERADRLPICVEPDDCEYQPEVFAHVAEATKQLEQADPERSAFHSHPIAQANHEKRIRLRALRQAVQQAVEAATLDPHVLSFVSEVVRVDDYTVCIVLQVSRDLYDTFYRLGKSTAANRGPEPSRLATSLLDATINEFLGACTNELSKPNAGSGWSVVEDDRGVLDAAAKSLMSAAALAGGNRGVTGYETDGLYQACNTISTLKYEGKEGIGRLVLGRPDHAQVLVDVAFTPPVSIRDYAAVRKLLQLATGPSCLLCDSAEIYGLGRVAEGYDPKAEDVFTVTFRNQFVWELSHAGQLMLRVQFGEPGLVPKESPEQKLHSDLPRIFKDISPEALHELVSLVSAVSELKHGAMLVVSSCAESEAERLGMQCIRVRPFKLTKELLTLVTAIDGAVLVDPAGFCHAIGVILDGTASPQCSPSRGARFNSAIRYVDARGSCMAVVKSEDGMLDIFPRLMPQIRRAEIVKSLAKLRSLAAAQTVHAKDLGDVLDWLRDHAFYLLAEDCDEINRLLREAEKRLADGEWPLAVQPFEPAKEMNESYFLKEAGGS
jgi:hypothetical protein